MTEPIVDQQAGEQATLLQIAASDPKRSVFVSANAGTGKTQVLTMRVLRLLLSGVAPDTILCVTYTKAAAAEMKSRLYEKLSSWAICEQVDLIAEMKKLGEHRPTQTQIQTARSLFAHILDHEDGPRIETVHSFCQAVLKRFPIEANVPPDFQLLSDLDSERLLTDCFFALLEQAGQILDIKLAEALSVLTQQTDETQAIKHIKSHMRNRRVVDALAHDPMGFSAYETALRQTLKIDGLVDLEAEEKRLGDEIGRMPLARIADALLQGGATQAGRGQRLQLWLDQNQSSEAADLSGLMALFATSSGARLKRMTDKQVDKYDPDCGRLQNQVTDRLQLYFETKSAERCIQLSLSLARVAVAVYRHFQARKLASGRLDYEDLIFFTETLLDQDQMMAWVRWKLDQGINHLLIDEAQDTSPAQWSLLNKLSDPFFDGDEESQDRTVFAVGDFKQSIYSFQGANPQTFAESQNRFVRRAAEVHKPFEVVDFSLSFRSSQAVLEFVDSVMTADEVTGLGAAPYQHHDVFRTGMAGLVEVWPVQAGAKKAELPMFDAPDLLVEEDSDTRHAKQIVSHIQALLDGAETDLFGRVIRPQDILILLRRRDSFFALLRAELERANIPVAGADRIVLNNQIEILDLLALGDVCLLPEDDLQLACLLKSPLIGLSEDDLFELAARRDDTSLFEALTKAAAVSSCFAAAVEKLNRWLGLADQLPVFEFFSVVLTAGGRQAFHRRLGPAVDDSLNAFLLQAREHGQQGQGGLSHFLNFFRQGGSEIKRDMDMQDAGQVRVMSVHGAKGLEAPIVYLPDMLRATQPSDSLVQGASGLFWPSGQAAPLALIDQMKQQNKHIRQEEDFRLLYVALTRARQALFISGWEKPRQRMMEDSWYHLLSRQIQNCAGAFQTETGIWRLETSGEDAPERPQQQGAEKDADVTVPQWFTDKPPAEPTPFYPLVPSDLGATDQAVLFTAEDRQAALLRGQFVHKLFEVLPQMHPDSWVEAAQIIAASMMAHLPSSKSLHSQATILLDQLIKKAIAVMTDPRLAAVFGPDSLAEVSLSGMVGDRIVQGQVDRLTVGEHEVLLVDFKTGTPPADDDRLPDRYIRQMAVYADILRQIYPDKAITCWLVWTQTAQISALDETQRNAALRELMVGI